MLRELRRCFDGRIPAVVATASGDGSPNVTYLSTVHPVDDERIALSNQFMSKTARNLAENPQASLLLLDPLSFAEWRLSIVYERTERRGPVFDRLRDDVDRVASLTGMADVFRLRSADIYRVLDVEVVSAPEVPGEADTHTAPGVGALATLTGRLARCSDLDHLVTAALDGLDELLGYRHAAVLALDEHGRRLYTIASHGYPVEGVGSEVAVGDGVIGAAARRCEPVRIGQLRQMSKYAQAVRHRYETDGAAGPEREIPVPALPDVESRLAVPLLAFGQLVGVLAVESHLPMAFDLDDEAALAVVAAVVAGAIEADRAGHDAPVPSDEPATSPVTAGASPTLVRHFGVDGSTFLDGDYLIRGVAGRLLWSLLGQHAESGRVDFTTKEVRLDPSLELPAFRDNLDTRLVLLKRRLDEREAPVRIERTGRGRFRLLVEGPLRLESRD